MTARKILYWSLLIWLVFLCLLREWGFTEKWSRRWRLWGSSYDSDTSDEDEDEDGGGSSGGGGNSGVTLKQRFLTRFPRFPWPERPKW